MLRVISSIFFFFLVFSKNCENPEAIPKTIVKASADKTSVNRDFSINRNNAYNDLFLDSLEVEKFISRQKLNDSVSLAMRDFYNTRNFEYTWFSSAGLIEQSLSFHSMFSLDNESDLFSKSLENSLDNLRTGKVHTIVEGDPSIIKTELQITERFIRDAGVHNKSMSAAALAGYIPIKKAGILQRVDAVLTNSDYQKYASMNISYDQLKEQLKKYSIIQKNGGWQTIKATQKKYSKGETNPVISLIKKRLQITGELTGADTTGLFDAALENAVNVYQASRGYQSTGAVTAGLVKDMNITVLARLQQLIINMQRRRWMPLFAGDRLIIVNIPAFELYADSGKNSLFQMDVVVGSVMHNTTMFSGKINQVVFSPYWNIPPSIVKKEVLPGLRRDKEYLRKRNMEITGTEAGLPVVRQRPGIQNALGKVKFLFPNSFNIYMHDTPQKNFFNQSTRGLSHGCIRLSDPVKMANYLLENVAIWTPAKIDSAMNSGKEKFVALKTPVPVIITYYTSWIDKKGMLRFADDIYGHDKEMARKMFTDPQ